MLVHLDHLEKEFDPTPNSNTNYMGNGVVMGRAIAIVPNPAEIIYLQEENNRWNYAWLRPQLVDARRGQYKWWSWNKGTQKSREEYSNLHFGAGNLLFADGHAKYRRVDALRSRDFGFVPDDGIEADADKPYTASFCESSARCQKGACMLTPEQIVSFHERGYLRLERILDPEEVEGLRARLEEVLAGRFHWPDDCFQTLDPAEYRAPSGRPMPEGIQLPASQDERFCAVADHPRLTAAMRALIGPDAVRYTDQVILKTPGISPATFFHQDGFYWRNSGERTVNCWIALDDAGPGNGCLVFLPGSHRLGLQEHEAYFDEPALHHGRTGRPFQRLRIPLDRAASAAEVAEPVPAGGCLFFTKYTWHRSDPNRSAQRRRAYAVAYHSR